MKFHWKVLAWMLAGAVFGLVLRSTTAAPGWSGATWRDDAAGGGGVLVGSAEGPASRARLSAGDRVLGILEDHGRASQRLAPIDSAAAMEAALAELEVGDAVWLRDADGEQHLLSLDLDPDAPRAAWLVPLNFVADIFMTLLRMLIVPIVFTSIVVGVAGLGGGRDLGRLGGKAFLYYVCTSLLAIFVGQVLVSVVRPGAGAELGLTAPFDGALTQDVSFLDIAASAVPDNVFVALSDNRAMLKIIFFALFFGAVLGRTPAPHGPRIREVFESLLEVIMRLADVVLKLIPYGVFALIARVVATTGLGVFKPLLAYMAVVTVALLVHACVTLPLILRFVGRLSPVRWAKAMAPALVTAFSTSSSSMTLPVTLETVEKRGKVSNRVTSFTLPLGATVNMDGTALYECIGVIFLAQYYEGTMGFELTLSMQALVIVMALLASIGAAGIPSAGLVMMLTILSALELPLEGAALLLAVDRPLDMLRTVVNVWSDSCGAAVIARSEGETDVVGLRATVPSSA